MASPAFVPANELTEEEFERRTLAAIHREFGSGGLARFLMNFRAGRGDYTLERRQWMDAITEEELLRWLQKS